MAGRSGGGLHEDHPVRDGLFEEVPHEWRGQGLHQVHIVGRERETDAASGHHTGGCAGRCGPG